VESTQGVQEKVIAFLKERGVLNGTEQCQGSFVQSKHENKIDV